MIKGIEGMSYRDQLIVPIIENTARECDLTESLERAIAAYPKTQAVLVRRHGVYIWGRDWVHAKTQAECYDYLFRAAAEMQRMGIPTAAPKGVTDASLSSRPADQYARR
jgi:methylthioribulose 1-phosphate dehydratase/enolase-phosphatase E1